jgi:hypothetical protein
LDWQDYWLYCTVALVDGDDEKPLPSSHPFFYNKTSLGAPTSKGELLIMQA